MVCLAILLGACVRPASTGLPSQDEDIFATSTLTNANPSSQATEPSNMETPEDRGTFFPKTTFTPAETVDATVIVHFQNARIETVGFMDSGIMIVVVSIPGGVNGTFRAELGQIPFQCTIQEAIQDRLYCYGSPPVTPGKYPFAVFAGSADRPIFQTMLTTPLMPTPETTPTPRS